MWLYIGVLQGQLFKWMWLYVFTWIKITWLDSVFFSGELLSSTCKNANMTWLNSGVCWCMWFAKAAVWYGYSLCYNSGLVMYTTKEVAYLFTWRLFSILVLHLTWLNETVPSRVKCIINFSRMLCILENSALQKDAYLCINVRVGDMTRHGSTVRRCWAAHAALRTSV